jgi:hypothetical protein
MMVSVLFALVAVICLGVALYLARESSMYI